MEHENLTYPEALKWLAKKYHIEVVEQEETEETESSGFLCSLCCLVVVSGVQADQQRVTLTQGRCPGLRIEMPIHLTIQFVLTETFDDRKIPTP